MKILVIDDDDIIREVQVEALSCAGHEVTSARDGHEGLEIISDGHHDILVTDIFMPGKEGLEVIREVRKSHPDIKIIAISGGGKVNMNNVLKAADAFGADSVLRKPFTIDTLVDEVNKFAVA